MIVDIARKKHKRTALSFNDLKNKFDSLQGLLLGDVVFSHSKNGGITLHIKDSRGFSIFAEIIQTYEELNTWPFVKKDIEIFLLDSSEFISIQNSIPMLFKDCALYFSFKETDDSIILFNSEFGKILGAKNNKINKHLSIDQSLNPNVISLTWRVRKGKE